MAEIFDGVIWWESLCEISGIWQESQGARHYQRHFVASGGKQQWASGLAGESGENLQGFAL